MKHAYKTNESCYGAMEVMAWQTEGDKSLVSTVMWANTCSPDSIENYIKKINLYKVSIVITALNGAMPR
jgi:hypothetical protein